MNPILAAILCAAGVLGIALGAGPSVRAWLLRRRNR